MNAFSWSGRMNRAKYIGYSICASIIAGVIMYFIRSIPAVSGVVYLLLVVVSSMFVVKRFHDIEKPGWYLWLLLIPFYNIYLTIILLFKKGTTGLNAYGVDSLATGTA